MQYHNTAQTSAIWGRDHCSARTATAYSTQSNIVPLVRQFIHAQTGRRVGLSPDQTVVHSSQFGYSNILWPIQYQLLPAQFLKLTQVSVCGLHASTERVHH